MLEVFLTVQPYSWRQEIKILKNGTVKAFVKSVPENGRANRELIKFLASLLDVKRGSIKIKYGEKSKKKKLCIENITASQFINAVEKFHKKI